MRIPLAMAWSPQQDKALADVSAWLKRGKPQVFRLFGFAGTGKTTLARHLAEDIDGEVCFGAFTGKAALVMRSKGCKDARTIHSLIYRPKDIDSEEPSFILNDESPAQSASLIVIDECSMVDEELGRDLLSFGKPVLVLREEGAQGGDGAAALGLFRQPRGGDLGAQRREVVLASVAGGEGDGGVAVAAK